MDNYYRTVVPSTIRQLRLRTILAFIALVTYLPACVRTLRALRWMETRYIGDTVVWLNGV